MEDGSLIRGHVSTSMSIWGSVAEGIFVMVPINFLLLLICFSSSSAFFHFLSFSYSFSSSAGGEDNDSHDDPTYHYDHCRNDCCCDCRMVFAKLLRLLSVIRCSLGSNRNDFCW